MSTDPGSTLSALVDHILGTHHAYTRNELSRLDAFFVEVVDRHGSGHPELLELARLWSLLKADLEPHLLKEEKVLFPYIRALEESRAGAGKAPHACFGTVSNPIRIMTGEHREVTALLKEMDQTTGGYRVPDDGCPSCRALYQGLEALRADLICHIHLEDNILFPRCAELEMELRERA